MAKARTAKTRVAKAARPTLDRATLLWAGTFALLLGAIALTGLTLVGTAHETRGLYSSLGQVQHEQDKLLDEHSRLMLERGALTSMQNIEAVAQSELGMVFPEEVGQVLE